MHTSHVNPIKLNMGLSKNNLLSRRNILRINICFYHDFLTYMTGLLHEGIFHVGGWRPHQTCHLWKLALGLCDAQLDSDFNMVETLTQTVNWI